jgi:PPOX class probable F420-dependent enzyme
MSTLETSQLSPRQLRFIEENPFVGVVTTLREDGSPHSTVVWVDVDDGKVSFNTATGRAKPRHLERDPRLSLAVVDPSDAYRWIAVSGRAEITEDGADAQIDKLAKKYIGKDRYPWHKPTERRLKVLIEPDRIDAHGVDE